MRPSSPGREQGPGRRGDWLHECPRLSFWSVWWRLAAAQYPHKPRRLVFCPGCPWGGQSQNSARGFPASLPSPNLVFRFILVPLGFWSQEAVNSPPPSSLLGLLLSSAFFPILASSLLFFLSPEGQAARRRRRKKRNNPGGPRGEFISQDFKKTASSLHHNDGNVSFPSCWGRSQQARGDGSPASVWNVLSSSCAPRKALWAAQQGDQALTAVLTPRL